MKILETLRAEFADDIEHKILTPNALMGGYWTAEDIADQAIFEYIKMDYHNSAPTQSIRQHLGCMDDDTKRRQYVRLMKTVQFYRNLQNDEHEEMLGMRAPEYEPQIMDTLPEKLAGHQLNAVQFREVTSLHDVPLFLKMVQHQIDDKKKVSYEQFIILFHEYSSYIESMLAEATMPCQIIQSTVELFQIEWKYCIHLFYSLALESENKGKLRSIPTERIKQLCSTVYYPSKMGIVGLENRMLMHRNMVAADVLTLSDAEWEPKKHFLLNSLCAKEAIVKAVDQAHILQLIHGATLEEQAQFIK